ncbi:hypothetical protein GOP47_0017418 [Adiantum capillus-veneris]|uniref:Uncharacterized protein n=1 Tax=Adiantum capillus-veneris TaxID=13818 RepID=A0A9D4UFE3_ADICA|nr:hypothetical protein GOP47_0017418 [Adiantum capillus-veneris]
MDASLAKKKNEKKARSPSSTARTRLLATPCNHPGKAPGEVDVCFICHDAGTLLKCDRRQCEKAYHPECVRRNVAPSKKAWICARHFCSKCSKQPCTYCVMCPRSFCSKCLPMVVYCPLSEEAGFCESCIPLIELIEHQQTLENSKASNLEISETRRGLILVKEIMPAASDQNVQVSVKRLRSHIIRPKKKKIRVLRLLHDSSSEDEVRNTVSNGDMCAGNLQPTFDTPAHEKLLDIKALPTGFSANSGLPSSSTTRAPLFDSSETLPDALNISPSLHLVTSLPQMAKPRGVVNPAPLPVDKTSCKKTTIMTATKDFLLHSGDSLLDQVSSVTSVLGTAGTPAHPGNPKPLPAVKKSLFPSLPNPTHNSSISDLKPHSIKNSVHELYENAANSDKPISYAYPDRKQPSMDVVTDPHSEIATDSTSRKPTILAPINVQNVSLIFLRRSQIEELLPDRRFTLLILGAFVRIRNAKHGNNYRLVQIAGTTRQAQYYKVGNRTTNVALEVQNLNRRQQITIDHISDHMFTEEECKRLEQSIELGFIDAPTMGALEQMAAALQKGKANKGQELASMPLTVARIAGTNLLTRGAEVGKFVIKNCAGKDKDEPYKKKNGTSPEIRTGVTASVRHEDKTHSECGYPGVEEFSPCKDLGNLTADTQNKGWDGWWVVNQAQTATGKQLDGDQQSDISVELGTENLEGEQCNGITNEGSASIGKLRYPEDESEAMFPLKVLEKEHQGFALGSKGQEACFLEEAINEVLDVVIDRESVGIYTARMQSNSETLESRHCDFSAEHDTGSNPEVMNQPQVYQPMQDNTKTQLSTVRNLKEQNATSALVLSSNHFEVTQNVEGRMCTDKILSSSAMCGAGILNFSEETPQTDFQGYATSRDQVQFNRIGITCSMGDHAIKKGHVKEHALPVNSDEQSMEWFYQDRKEITHGPFSLKQLRKWAKTEIFPPDLYIWRAVSGEKFHILLKSALDVKETALPPRIETQKSPVSAEDCLNHGSKFFCDVRSSDTKTDLQVTSTTHITQNGDHGISIDDDRVTSIFRNGELTLLRVNNMSGNQEQSQGISVCRDSIDTKICERLSCIPEQISTNSNWEPCASAKIKALGGEVDCNFVLASDVHTSAMGILPKNNGNCIFGPAYANTSAKLTLADGGKDENAMSASMEETATEAELHGPSPACIEVNTALASTQRTLEPYSTSDGGQDSLKLVTHKLRSLSTVNQVLQLDEIEEEEMLRGCEKVSNEDLLVIREEHEKERVETTLVKDELLDKMSEEEPNSEQREQKQETFFNLNHDGWELPVALDSETLWTTQLDALKAEVAALDRSRDEIWSNLIDEVTMVENQWPSDLLPENASVDWGKKACSLEQRQGKNIASDKEDYEDGTSSSANWSSVSLMKGEDRPGNFLYGWATPNNDDIVQGTLVACDSTWSTGVQLQGLTLQRSPDLLSSKKRQPRSEKQDEKKVKDLQEGGSETDAEETIASLTAGAVIVISKHLKSEIAQNVGDIQGREVCAKGRIEGKSWREQNMAPGKSLKQEEARRFHARNECKYSAGKHSENHHRFKSRGQKGRDEGRSISDDHRHSRLSENCASPKSGKAKTDEAWVSRPRSGERYQLHGEGSPKRSRRNREEPTISYSRSRERSHSREREVGGSRSISRRGNMEERTYTHEEQGRKSCATISTSRECESPRTCSKKIEEAMRENRSQNDYKSRSRHRDFSPESPRKKFKDGRRSYVRNDGKCSSAEEESWEGKGRRKDHSKRSCKLRSHQTHILRSGLHTSPSHVYRNKQEYSSKSDYLCAHRKDLDDSVYWRRHNVNNRNGARRHLISKGFSPGKNESLSGIHVVSPSQPPPFDDRGWTPPSSPLNNQGWTPPSSPLNNGGWTPLICLSKTPANCDSSVIASAKRPSHPLIQSSASIPGAIVQEGSIDLPRASPMKLPSPPPLPGETSHLWHIDD